LKKTTILCFMLFAWLPLQAHSTVGSPAITQKEIDTRFFIQVVKEALKTDSNIYALNNDIDSIQTQIDHAGSATDPTSAMDIALLKTSLQLAKAHLSEMKTKTAAQALNILSDYYSLLVITQISKHQVQHLKKFVTVIENRQLTGDAAILKNDVFLAKQSFAGAVVKHANRGRELTDAKNSLEKISQLSIKPSPVLSITLPSFLNENVDFKEMATQHPAFKIEQLKIELAKRYVHIMGKEKRIDKISGVRFSKIISDIPIGLHLVKPWQLSNNDRDAGIRSARHIQRQNEFEAVNVMQMLVADLKASESRYKLTANAWRIWTSTMKNQYPEHIQLLEQLWKVKKLSTTQYLDQLDKNYNGQIAGPELLSDVWHAWFGWLAAKGDVMGWLDTLNKK